MFFGAVILHCFSNKSGFFKQRGHASESLSFVLRQSKIFQIDKEALGTILAQKFALLDEREHTAYNTI